MTDLELMTKALGSRRNLEQPRRTWLGLEQQGPLQVHQMIAGFHQWFWRAGSTKPDAQASQHREVRPFHHSHRW